MSGDIVTGKCACEEVKFHVRGNAITTLACYCPQCRKASGGSGHLLAIYDTEQVEVDSGSEHLGTFVIEGDKTTSGHDKVKVFCKECGTTLWYKVNEGERTVVITATLDADYEKTKPQSEIFTRNQPSFIPRIDGTHRFEGMVAPV
ncbi:hypothetical protein NA57DRAFT_58107 [Rhizodiscina lignyota]|uniref:CENP-V/GFA domain-containing protein n=1 Tax=Rhizodiscina lignyota TaxID=1504668 RepID=A0A9P4IB90_9PEZI|nr:hypothetical protein NA57DRAFT_58107 [Rhizodiscina lignyota]